MRTVCMFSDCGAVIVEGESNGEDSHGICLDCLNKHFPHEAARYRAIKEHCATCADPSPKCDISRCPNLSHIYEDRQPRIIPNPEPTAAQLRLREELEEVKSAWSASLAAQGLVAVGAA